MIFWEYMRIIENKEKIGFLVILLFLVFISLKPLTKPGFFPIHDDVQVMRLLGIDKCLKDGQFPCRWVPDMGYGYGYPQFNYYSPLPYYIMEIFHLIGFGFLDSIKIGFALGSLIGILGMYLLANSLWGGYSGILASLLYAYLPYKAVNIYVRGSLAELWGLAFFPLVLWSAKKLIESRQKIYILSFAIFLFFLFTSHNISAFIFLPVVFLWIFFLFFRLRGSKIENLKIIGIRLLLGFLWAVGLSAFFIFPSWFEKDLVHLETIRSGYFSFFNHFVGIKQLLFSNYWGYGVSEPGQYDEILLSVGFWYWFLPLIPLFFFLIKKRAGFIEIVFFILLGWAFLFMVHPRSAILWEKISYLSFVQFPWRFLGPAGFCFSLSAAACGSWFKEGKKFFMVMFLPISILILIFYSSFFRPREILNISDKEKFSGDEWLKQQTISIYDYLPIYVEKVPDTPASSEPLVLKGSVEILKVDKGSNWIRWNLMVRSDSSKVLLPMYYFPDFTVKLDSDEWNFSRPNENGLVSVEIPFGKHELMVKIDDTKIRRFSNLLSFGAVMMIPIFLRKLKKTYET